MSVYPHEIGSLDEQREIDHQERTITGQWLDHYKLSNMTTTAVTKFRRGIQELLFLPGTAITVEKLTSVRFVHSI